jgi:hypothetical protein
MTPHGDRLESSAAHRVRAARAPLVYVTTEHGASGVESVTVSVVWDEEARSERDDVRIYRDGSLSCSRARERPAAEAVGRDEHTDPDSVHAPWLCSKCGGSSRASARRCEVCGRDPAGDDEQEGDDREHGS